MTYSEDILAIHNDFDIASEKLVENANKILQEAYNKRKANILSEIGFTTTPEYKKYLAKQKEQEKASKTIEAINSLKKKFPFNKCIDNDTVTAICKKYNLVFGESTLFSGFIPDKNATEINNFFKSYPTYTVKYIKHHIFTGSTIELSKEDYEENKNNPGYIYQYDKYVKPLYIVAPITDMNIENKYVENYRLKDIPIPEDPTVLLPIRENGLEFFLIVSKWGNESSDELLQDSTMN